MTESQTPTAAEAAQVAGAGAAALAEAPPGLSKDEYSTIVREAIREEAKDLRVELSEDQAKMVANATIAQLEARGATRMMFSP